MKIIATAIITLLVCNSIAYGKGTKNEFIKCDHDFVSFSGKVFTDMNHQWVYIPPKFKNSLITSIKGREKEPLEFTVLKPTKVTLLTGYGDRSRFVKDGWKLTDTAKWKTTGDPLTVFILEKDLDTGDYEFFSDTPVGIRLIQMK